MIVELLLRFLIGGAVVSVFALAGELFSPKTFSGLFGAAPSVAIASLALAIHQHGAGYAEVEARSMVLGSGAMLVYCIACVTLIRRHGVPVWAGAAACWVAWFGAAFLIYTVGAGLVTP